MEDRLVASTAEGAPLGLQPAAAGAPPAEAAPAGAGACAAGALGLPPAGGPFAAIGGTAWGCSVLGMVVCVQRLIYRSNCSTLLSVLRWAGRIDEPEQLRRPKKSHEPHSSVERARSLSPRRCSCRTHTPWRPQTRSRRPLERPQNDEAQDQAAQGRGLRDGDRRRQKGAPPNAARTPLRLELLLSIAGPLRRLVAAAGVGAQEDHRGDQEHDRAEADLPRQDPRCV